MNPLKLRLLIVLLASIGLVGAGAAWKVQGWRLAAVKAEYAGFVATVKAQGEAAEKLAKATAAADKQNKERVDREYQTTITSLAADVKRLRDARTRAGYVPATPAGSRSPDLACFDRAELEQALRRFDEGVTGLIGEGDTTALGLNAARSWANGIRANNPAIDRP